MERVMEWMVGMQNGMWNECNRMDWKWNEMWNGKEWNMEWNGMEHRMEQDVEWNEIGMK